MFKIDHVGLNYQMVAVGGKDGIVTYYEFSGPGDAGTAFGNAQKVPKSRPCEWRRYGSFVVYFQVTTHDEAQLKEFVDQLDPILRGRGGS